MSDSSKIVFVGLDVHKDSIVAEAGRGPARAVATVPFDAKALKKVLERLGPIADVSCCRRLIDRTALVSYHGVCGT